MDANKSVFVERCLACEADAVGTVGRLKKRAEVGLASEATLHGSDRTDPFTVRLARLFLPDHSRW